MTYTYTCTKCAETVELVCSMAERPGQEKGLACPRCGSAKLARVFNAMILRRGDGSAQASFRCGPNAKPGCCPGR